MNKNLETLRKRIDTLDERLFNILSKRMKIVHEIGKIKKEQKISALDKKRWEQILKGNKIIGQKLGLSERFIQDILNTIHEYSLKIQK